ncbi:MAG: peroxide stress protein YaaA [Chloroflexota bacterium]
MLIIVPSSETKRPAPQRGRPLALDTLAFPALTEVRSRVAEALVATSGQPDARKRLLAGASLAGEVERNALLFALPTRPALEVYTGTLHGGLGAASLSPAARRRAATRVVVASALFGALRPADRIPPYRLNICSRLLGIEHLEPLWRTVIPDLLAEAAGSRGVIVDLRSGTYQAMGVPTGLGDRTVTIHVGGADGGRVGNVFLKRLRGEAARFLLESGEDPRTPQALAGLLGTRWPVGLEPPDRPGGPWALTLSMVP